MFLADVTGHGIGPAILASVCRAYSRASFNERDNLATIFRNINQSFSEDLTPERFATFVAAVFREGSDQVELLSAGHGPLFIYSARDKSLRYMHAQVLPFGILPEMEGAVPTKLAMERGDMVLLITDGFFEWENPSRSHSEPIVLPKSFEGSVIAIQKSSSPSFMRRSLASPEGRRSRMI